MRRSGATEGSRTSLGPRKEHQLLDHEPQIRFRLIDIGPVRNEASAVSRLIADVAQTWQTSLSASAEIPVGFRERFVDELAQVQEITTGILDSCSSPVMLESLDDQRFYKPANHNRAGIKPAPFVAAIDLIHNAFDVSPRSPNDREWKHLLGLGRQPLLRRLRQARQVLLKPARKFQD